MERIVNHPILTIPQEGEHTFLFNGKPVTGMPLACLFNSYKAGVSVPVLSRKRWKTWK